MSRSEILVTTYSEMTDMISCLSIYEGTAVPKKQATHYTSFDEAIRLR